MMENNQYIITFLKQAVLGQSIPLDDPEKVFERCIKLADNDMLSGGRFAIQCSEKRKQVDRVTIIKEIIHSDNYDLLHFYFVIHRRFYFSLNMF